ncbi:hypothetical protein [Streptomyces sp. KS_16]|nr:hypothetical protein [Streptomyces sp. KS_16]
MPSSSVVCPGSKIIESSMSATTASQDRLDVGRPSATWVMVES